MKGALSGTGELSAVELKRLRSELNSLPAHKRSPENMRAVAAKHGAIYLTEREARAANSVVGAIPKPNKRPQAPISLVQ